MKQWKVLNQGSQSRIQTPVGEIIQILLTNRGIKSAGVEKFLHPILEDITLKSVGIDGKEIKKFLSLIRKTIESRKAIIIYGDYDVDGVCATAILWETIYSFYKDVHPYIPHRIDEGYGISVRGIETIKDQRSNVGLIITVDNGIVANKAVDYAKKLGIKVVVSDHHVKGEKALKADAILHTTALCGTGIAYLLSKEIYNLQFTIYKQFPKDKLLNEEKHLELVALATVADLVPLNIYNRTLLKFGKNKLQ